MSATTDDQLSEAEVKAEKIARDRLRNVWMGIVPPRWRSYKGLEDVDQPDVVLKEVRDWLEYSDGGNLLIFGPVGTGKTHLAIAAFREFFRQYLRYAVMSLEGFIEDPEVIPVFAPVVEMLNDLRPGGENDLKRYYDCDLLVLDDLGTERGTEWAREQLFAVIDSRYRRQMPIIVTTNLTPDDLKASVGERCYDRLIDGAFSVRLSGQSRRKPVPDE